MWRKLLRISNLARNKKRRKMKRKLLQVCIK
jgi:hypothetical protein